MKGIYEKATEKVTGRDSPLRKDPRWEDVLSTTAQRLLSHRLVWASHGQIPPLPAQSVGLRALLLAL